MIFVLVFVCLAQLVVTLLIGSKVVQLTEQFAKNKVTTDKFIQEIYVRMPGKPYLHQETEPELTIGPNDQRIPR